MKRREKKPLRELGSEVCLCNVTESHLDTRITSDSFLVREEKKNPLECHSILQ